MNKNYLIIGNPVEHSLSPKIHIIGLMNIKLMLLIKRKH